MKNIGLGPIADRIAAAALDAMRAKKGAAETRRRLTADVLALLGEAVVIGVDQALIAAARHDAAAVNAVAARKAELLAKDRP